MILLMAALSLAVLIVETLNLFPFPVKAVSVLPAGTCITRNVRFVCPVNSFPATTDTISEGDAGNFTPWRPNTHFDYDFLRLAFRKVLLEQLSLKLGPSL